jgi:hypothetical protein
LFNPKNIAAFAQTQHIMVSFTTSSPRPSQAEEPLSLKLKLFGSKKGDQALQDAFQIAWGVVLGIFAGSDRAQFGLIDASISTKRATCTIVLDDAIPICQLARETKICQENTMERLESITVIQQLSTSVEVHVSSPLHRQRGIFMTNSRALRKLYMSLSKGQ